MKAMKLRVNSRILVSVVYGLFGLIDLIIFAFTKVRMLHIGVLGLLTTISGLGLFYKINKFYFLAVLITPIIFITGLSTLISSIGFFGLNSNPQLLLLNVGLIAYSVITLILFFYLISHRNIFLKEYKKSSKTK